MRRPLARSLVLGRPGLFYGPAVRDYLDRVRAADGDGLSRGVTNAINTYISGLISANLLGTSGGVISQAASTIKAHCILAAANTLSGCLVPVVGPAPTNVNWVPADYNRKTGLGDPSNISKYLNTGYSSSSDGQNSVHLAVRVSSAPTGSTASYLGQGAATTGATHIAAAPLANEVVFRCRNFNATRIVGIPASGFIGMNRSLSTSFNYRITTTAATATVASEVPAAQNHFAFARNEAGTPAGYGNQRMQLYSIGSNLDLSILRDLQDQLAATLAAVIP